MVFANLLILFLNFWGVFGMVAQINNKNQTNMDTLYNRTQDKNKKIRAAGYNLIEI